MSTSTMAPARVPTPRTPEPDDEVWQLVAAAQGGDRQAFGELYSRYHGMIFRYVMFRVGDRTLAEDLAGETFLRAWRRIDTVSYQGRDIGAWFVTIARNLVCDHAKSSATRLTALYADLAERPGGGSDTSYLWIEGPRPAHDVAAGRETARQLSGYVVRLNPLQAEVIRLRFIVGLTVNEAAERVGVNSGALKAIQHRAVSRLARLMAADGYTNATEFAGGLAA